jgi:metal-sulfur cluster biosynthetic enzyme
VCGGFVDSPPRQIPFSLPPGHPDRHYVDNLVAALSTVIDPELGIDAWTLGLAQELEMNEQGRLVLRFVFTTPFCPYGPALMAEMERALADVFAEPPVLVLLARAWTPPDEVKALLGLPGSW